MNQNESEHPIYILTCYKKNDKIILFKRAVANYIYNNLWLLFFCSKNGFRYFYGKGRVDKNERLFKNERIFKQGMFF